MTTRRSPVLSECARTWPENLASLSGLVTVNKSVSPSSNAYGWPAHSPPSIATTRSGSAPPAVTLKMPSAACPTKMSPEGLQCTPQAPRGSRATSIAAPPRVETLLTSWPLTKPTHSPSGEKNGVDAR